MTRQRGLALLVTLSAIALLGVLAVASTRIARARMTGARRLQGVHSASLEVARTLDSALAAWPVAERARMALGERGTLLAILGRDHLVVTRLTRTLYRLDASTQRGDAVAPTRQAASLIVRVVSPTIDVGAALITSGNVRIERTFLLTSSTDPTCSGASIRSDVLASDTTHVLWENPSRSVRENASLADSSHFIRQTGIDVQRLKSTATVSLRDGDGYRPVADSARLVFGEGDLSVGPGDGEGMIFTLGRLTLVGPLRFRGVLVALGGVESSGNITIDGAIWSRGDVTLHEGVLRYDACAASQSALLAARARPLPNWSFAPLP